MEKNVSSITKDSGGDKLPAHNARNSRPKHIDRKQRHELGYETCPNYDGRLIKKSATEKRMVIEMPMPSPEIVDHELALYYCRDCVEQTSASVGRGFL